MAALMRGEMAEKRSKSGLWWALNAGFFVPLSFVVSPIGLLSLADPLIDWNGFLYDIALWWDVQILTRIDAIIAFFEIPVNVPDEVKTYICIGLLMTGGVFRGAVLAPPMRISILLFDRGAFGRFFMVALLILYFIIFLIVFLAFWPIAVVLILSFLLTYLFNDEWWPEIVNFSIIVVGPFFVFGGLAAFNHFVLT